MPHARLLNIDANETGDCISVPLQLAVRIKDGHTCKGTGPNNQHLPDISVLIFGSSYKKR